MDITPTSNATAPMLKCRYGTMTLNPNDRLAGESLAHYGEWAEQELDALSRILEPGASVLEVGSNLGAQTLWFARTVGPDGNVFVTEPQRLDFQFLCANAAINGLTNLHAYPIGLGKESTTTKMVAYDPSRPYRSGRNLNDGLESKSESVNINTVDGLKINRLSLIKINAPADPIEVLSGAIDTIKRDRPAIYCKLGEMDEARHQIKFIRELGYNCWSHLAYLHNPANYNGSEQNIYPGLVLQNVLALPVERGIDFDDLVTI